MKMRLVDGYVVDLAADPAASFHPILAAEFIDVPEDAPEDLRPGYHYEDGEWTAPPTAADPGPAEPQGPVYRTAVSKVEYYGLFEPLEEAMIRLTASKTVTAEEVEAASDEDREKLIAILVLKVMLSRVDNLSFEQRILLNDQQVQKGLALCVTMGLLKDDRAAEIARGVPESPTAMAA